MPKISFEPPRKLELALLVIMIFTLFLFDINLNKLNDKGLNYEATVFGDFKIKSIVLFWSSIIVYHIILFAIYTRSILSKGTHHVLDYIFGTLTAFGTLILISGALLHFYSESFPFFTTTLSTITYYHIGIGLQVLGSIWFAVTE